jgi:hypothetical protein
MNPTNAVNSSLIQYHVYKMALLSAQVYDLVHYATHLSAYELEQLSAKLGTWHEQCCECTRKLVDGGPWLISPPSCQTPGPVPRPHRVVSSTGDWQRSDQPVYCPTGSVLPDSWMGKKELLCSVGVVSLHDPATPVPLVSSLPDPAGE